MSAEDHRVREVRRSQRVYQGYFIEVRHDDIVLESGREIDRDVIVHPDCVGGLALAPDGRAVLVRQYRHAVGKTLWELPAGKIDDGETPEQAFRRELREECGLRCGDAVELVSYLVAPGSMTHRFHLYLGLDSVHDGAWDDEEIAEWKAVTLEEAEAMVASGELEDAKSLMGVLLWRARVQAAASGPGRPRR